MRLLPWLTALALLVPCGLPAAEHPGDLTRLIDTSPPAAWPALVAELVDEKGAVPRHAITTLLHYLPLFDAPERAVVAWGLHRATGHRPAQEALASLARDTDAAVREKAVQALMSCTTWETADLLASILTLEEPHRVEMAGTLKAVYVRDVSVQRDALGLRPLELRETFRLAQAGATVGLVEPVIALLRDPDPAVRKKVIDSLQWFADPRVDEALLETARDPDEEVRQAALWALAYRRNPAALEPLMAWAAATPPDQDRAKHFGWIGDAYRESALLTFFELRETAADDTDRRDAASMIGWALRSEVIEDEAVMAAMERYRDHPDPYLRESAGKLLAWRAKAERRRYREQSGVMGTAGVMVVLALVSAFLGVVVFVWAFRMLLLKVTLARTGVSKVRSLALGTVLVEGRARPVGSKLLVRPETGEGCLFYAGADRDYPGHRFCVEDETGRVLVDPAGAVLLSEDGVVSVGERVRVLAEAMLTAKAAGRGPERLILRKKRVERMLLARVFHFLVQGVMGGLVRRGTARALFSDPSSVFWIWDGAQARPFASARETARLFAVFLAAGAWIAVFAASVVAVLDANTGAAAGDWLRVMLGF